MRKIGLTRVLFCVAAVAMLFLGGQAEPVKAASKIQDLKEKKTYKIDLNKDGKKETISYKMTTNSEDESTYKIIINGKIMASIKKLYSAYDPHMQITDIDTKDGAMDIWVYTMGSSEDVIYSGLYQYRSGKLKKLYELNYKEIDENYHLVSGILYKADGNGKFYVKVDRAFFVDTLIGNHFDLIPMQLKNGKVSLVKTNTYPILETYNTEENPLMVAVQLDFYKKPDKSSGIGLTLKRWDSIKPVSIYRSGETLYVKFKTEKGKYGWLCADEYDFGEAPILNIILCD